MTGRTLGYLSLVISYQRFIIFQTRQFNFATRTLPMTIPVSRCLLVLGRRRHRGEVSHVLALSCVFGMAHRVSYVCPFYSSFFSSPSNALTRNVPALLDSQFCSGLSAVSYRPSFGLCWYLARREEFGQRKSFPAAAKIHTDGRDG